MANTQDSNEGVTVYELGYLILPSISEDQLSTVVDKLKAVVSNAGGKEIDGEAPFKQALAYTMSKTIGASSYVVKEAYIGWMKFELEPAKALEVKMEVEKMDEVLRSLIIKAPRESDFTFAKAEAAIAEKARLEAVEAEVEAPAEEVVSATEVVVE